MGIELGVGLDGGHPDDARLCLGEGEELERRMRGAELNGPVVVVGLHQVLVLGGLGGLWGGAVEPSQVVKPDRLGSSSATSESKLSTASHISSRSDAGRHATGPETGRGDPASACTIGATRRTPAPSRIRHRSRGSTDSPEAWPAAYSSNADLPAPGSPRNTGTR